MGFERAFRHRSYRKIRTKRELLFYLCLGGNAARQRVWHYNGAGWNQRSGSGNDVLPNAPMNAITVDPDNPTHVYVGGDVGVWRSIDSGLSWQPIAKGLPDSAVLDFSWHNYGERLLRASTYGRGVFEFPVDHTLSQSVQLYIRSTILDPARESPSAFEIVATDLPQKRIDIGGDHRTLFAVGRSFDIRGSSGNDGAYTVSAVSFHAPTRRTAIVVQENLTNADATGFVLAPTMSLPTFPIVAVTPAANQLDIAGDHTRAFRRGATFYVRKSTGNDGRYTVSTVNFIAAGSRTRIVTNENIGDATVDGELWATALGLADPTDTSVPFAPIAFGNSPDIRIDAPTNNGNYQFANNHTPDFVEFVDQLNDESQRVRTHVNEVINRVYV